MLTLTLLLHLLGLVVSSAGQYAQQKANKSSLQLDIKAPLMGHSCLLIIESPFCQKRLGNVQSWFSISMNMWTDVRQQSRSLLCFTEIRMSENDLLKNKNDVIPHLRPFSLLSDWFHTSSNNENQAATGNSFDSTPHISHADSQIARTKLPFALFIARYAFVPAEFTERFWTHLLALFSTKVRGLSNPLFSFCPLSASKLRSYREPTVSPCYLSSLYIQSHDCAHWRNYLVTVTDASTQEDTADFYAGKNSSISRFIFADISALLCKTVCCFLL